MHPDSVRQNIIVNADDFGADNKTNRRIITCIEKGLISSTTIMTNMPGFEEVRTWLKSAPANISFGIHLNITEGHAVSAEFCDAYPPGELFYRGKLLTAERRYLKILYAEFSKQIDRLMKTGIRVSHIDSHHHMHTYLPVGLICIRLAKKYAIKHIRFAQTIGAPRNLIKHLYRYLYNRHLAAGIGSDIIGLGSLAAYMDHFHKTNGTIELMGHPGSDSDYELLLSDKYRSFLSNCKLYNYLNI